MNPLVIVAILMWIGVIILVIKHFLAPPLEPPKLDNNTPSPQKNSVEHKEGGIKSASSMKHDVSETVLRLIDSGEISYPGSVSDRNKFIAENFGKVWDALLSININANVGIMSQDFGEHISYDETNSTIAWHGLAEVLILILVLEDRLGTDITPSLKYDKLNDFSVMKAKIRSRIQS